MIPIDRTTDGEGDVSLRNAVIDPDDRGRLGGGGNYCGKFSWPPEIIVGSVRIDDVSTFVGLELPATTCMSGW